MKNLPQIFTNPKFGEIRTIEIEGKVHFVASDIAKALGYTNPSKAISDHCKGVTKRYIPTNGGNQEMNVIPEGDIYRLAAKSELPGAEEFEGWIFDEVLPTVQKHGAYMTPATIEEALTNPDFIIQLATRLKEEQAAKKQLQEQIVKDRPYTNFAKAIEHSTDSITLGEFAKVLNNNGISIGRNRFFDWLRDNRYLIQGGKEKNKPQQRYIEQGLFQVKESVIHAINGDLIRTTTLITGKGQLYFLDKLRELSA